MDLLDMMLPFFGAMFILSGAWALATVRARRRAIERARDARRRMGLPPKSDPRALQQVNEAMRERGRIP